MGIRINKCIGYAIKGLKYDGKNYCLNDDRINPLGYLITDYEDREDIWTINGFLTFCKNRMEETNYHLLNWRFKEDEYFDFYDMVECDQEFGREDVLMLMSPLYFREWKRTDNIIDYVEHNQLYRGATIQFLPLDTAIWPYSGYINCKTGERCVGKEGRIVGEIWFSYRSSQDGKIEKFIKNAEFLASTLDMTLDQAINTFVPSIPEEIIMMAKYLNLFNDESTIFELRPAVYTFWR